MKIFGWDIPLVSLRRVYLGCLAGMALVVLSGMAFANTGQPDAVAKAGGQYMLQIGAGGLFVLMVLREVLPYLPKYQAQQTVDNRVEDNRDHWECQLIRREMNHYMERMDGIMQRMETHLIALTERVKC